MRRPVIMTVLLCAMGLASPTLAATPFVLETVDATGNLGDPSLALDRQGNPHICYFNYDNNLFIYTSKTCGVWTFETIADVTFETEVEPTSLVLDAQDNPHISFHFSKSLQDLGYASKSTGVWTIETVDSAGSMGVYNSIAVDAQGNPRIGYWDATNFDLKYASKSAGTWTLETVDATGDVGRATSLALDAQGNPGISYYDQTKGDLKYASRTSSGWAIETVDANVDAPGGPGSGTSLALDPQGNPRISYYDRINSDLKYANRTGSGWAIETVDATVDAAIGYQTSLALDAQGNPSISYYDDTNTALKYASRTNAGWAIETVDTAASGFYELPLALDREGRPSISYMAYPGYALRYAGPASDRPPDCSLAVASEPVLWPPNHKYHPISILGVTDPDCDPVTITVTGITQDEPLNTRGDGNTCPDGQIVSGGASVRAERAGTPGIPGNGRVYVISFTASDGRGGQCSGSVSVCVPHDQGNGNFCIDSGQKYNSLGPCTGGSRLSQEITEVGLTVGTVTGSQAALEFALPYDTQVELSVFDVAGRRLATVENGSLAAGLYQRSWDMSSATKGLYFVRLRAGAVTLTKTVVKLR